MRISCLECVRKHLGSAGVFIKETKLGYPDYDIWVIGELEHAADECSRLLPELSAIIREHRIAWTNNHSHLIPFEKINAYLKACMTSNPNDMPIAPEDLFDNLEVDQNGKMVVTMDTRV